MSKNRFHQIYGENAEHEVTGSPVTLIFAQARVVKTKHTRIAVETGISHLEDGTVEFLIDQRRMSNTRSVQCHEQT